MRERHRRRPERAAELALGGDLLVGGGARERLQLEQRCGGGGAVEVSVGEDRAHVGAVRSAVVGVQLLDEARADLPDRQRPALRNAVGVSGVGEHVPNRDAVLVHPLKDGHERGGS